MRQISTLLLALAIALPPTLHAATARADGPTTADCLAASEASLRWASEHKLRAERVQAVVCASATCPGAIRKECLARVDEVNRQLPTIIFGAKDASGGDITAVKVAMDGEPLATKLDGAPLTVDPGPHVFTFDAGTLGRVSKSLLIEQSQKDRHELITLVVSPKAGSAVAVPPPPDSASGLGTQRKLAIAAASVGVVGLIVGGVFGGLALSEKSTAQGACPSASCPTMGGSSDWSTAGTFATVSTVGFIVGGVGVAGAAALWFTAPARGVAASAGLELVPGGLRLRGTW